MSERRSAAPLRAAVVRGLERPMRLRTAVPWMLLVAVILAAAVVACATAIDHRADTDARLDARSAVLDQAGPILRSVFSVDAATWRADRAAARERVAQPLAASIRSALESPLPAGVRWVRWEPLHTGVVDAAPGRGTALVRVRVTVADKARETNTLKTVQAELVESDGRWLLAGMDELQ